MTRDEALSTLNKIEETIALNLETTRQIILVVNDMSDDEWWATGGDVVDKFAESVLRP